MHTIELLEQATTIASRLGYGIRQEWMGGCGGGACEVAGRKWLFVDLALSPAEQLDQFIYALREDPGIYSLDLPADLAQLLNIRKAA
jgi:hypothetical protein